MTQRSLSYFRTNFENGTTLPRCLLKRHELTEPDRKTLWELYAPEVWQDPMNVPHKVFGFSDPWPAGLGTQALYWVLKNVPLIHTLDALGMEATTRVYRALRVVAPAGRYTYWNGWATGHPVGQTHAYAWFTAFSGLSPYVQHHLGVYPRVEDIERMSRTWEDTYVHKLRRRNPFHPDLAVLRTNNPFPPLVEALRQIQDHQSLTGVLEGAGLYTLSDPRAASTRGFPRDARSLVVFHTPHPYER